MGTQTIMLGMIIMLKRWIVIKKMLLRAVDVHIRGLEFDSDWGRYSSEEIISMYVTKHVELYGKEPELDESYFATKFVLFKSGGMILSGERHERLQDKH